MTTILIWLGSGFAFSLGVMCGIAMFKIAGGNASRDEAYANAQARTLELLEERNEIGRRQVEALDEIAERMTHDKSNP
jgi:hypothetical protein